MRRGFSVLALLLAAGLAFAQEAEWYQGKPIRSIVFDGLQHVKLSDLEGVTDPFVGRLFTDDIFAELQGRLYALEYFERISPSAVPADPAGSQVVLRFRVTERPIVSRITFLGNRELRRGELLDAITLKINDVANDLNIRADEQAVYNKYLEKGFPDAQVRSESQPNEDLTVSVTFYITEGERITLEEALFEGNNTFSDRALRGRLSLKPKSLLNDGAFQEAKLIADRDAILQYYRDRGYIDAEITDVARDIRKDEKGANRMTLTFRIYEGRIYNFGGVTFEGNRIFTTDQLSEQIRSRPGDTVNARRLEADLQRVADLYYANGYIFNTINQEEERDMDGGTVSYHILIVERGRAHIENIIIRGNNKTKDNVILREIPLEAGDIFSRTKFMDGLRNLYNLQFFSNVLPDTLPGSADSLMDLVINVEEQPTMDIQFGLTFSGSSDPDAFPVSGLLRFNDRNFLGYGNTISAELNASPDTQTLTLGYTHRWMFGLPLSGSVDLTLYHTQRRAFMDNAAPFFNGDESYAFPDGFSSYDDYVNASKSPTSEYLMRYDQYNISTGFSTGYRWLTPLGSLGLGGGFRVGWVLNNYDASLYRPFDPVLRDRNQDFIPALSVWNSLSLDKRDIYYDPSSGYYAIQRFGVYGLLPDPIEREHYLKSETKGEIFFTLLNLPITENYAFKAVLGFHSGLSFILPQSPGRPLQIEQANMLSVDGMFIGRGWSEKRTDRGTALWENWAELRFPILPGMLAFDLFFDAAAAKSTPQDFFQNLKPDDMVYSMGFGPRFSIPQFPFRFLFSKGFTAGADGFKWKKGIIGATNDPASGIDFVISFALSTY